MCAERTHYLFIYAEFTRCESTCALASFFFNFIHFLLTQSQRMHSSSKNFGQSERRRNRSEHIIVYLKMQFRQLSVGKLNRRNSKRIQNARGHSNYFYRLFFVTDGHEEDEKNKNQVISNEERIIYRKFRTAAMVGRCYVLMINAPNNK